jgi:stage II sporulation protein D
MSSKKTWDLVPTAANQVYLGYQHEQSSSDLAVSQTTNQVLTYNGQVISAVFHSDAGGATENSEYAFTNARGDPGSKVPYLRGKPDVDPNGVPYDINTPNYDWHTGQFTMPQLSAIMATNSNTDVGMITNITFTRGVSGRAYQIVLVGTEGTKTMSGGRFQAVFNSYGPGANLKSNMFYLTPVAPP